MFFFFFQAEDGIRDLLVTGVQTCALPISWDRRVRPRLGLRHGTPLASRGVPGETGHLSSCIWNLGVFSRRCTGESLPLRDRKSTRLNSSHQKISYAVFCLKKKKKKQKQQQNKKGWHDKRHNKGATRSD